MCLKEVVIVYEGIVREFDNALLLKAELENRNYKVDIVYKTETFSLKRNNAICILPNGYNTQDIEFYRNILNANGNPLISLQYEQVLSKRIEDTKVHIPKGLAKEMTFICWGENCKKRLIENGIPEEKVKICGAIQLDFLRNEFDEFYLSRNKIAENYKLDIDKHWLLYISSFSYACNDKVVSAVATQSNDSDFANDFATISTNSQIETLKWFEKLIESNRNIVILYRPHPVEAENILIKNLEKKYHNNFRCINELSVKQWIKVSNIITTWFSTSLAEIYMAKKSVLLLRPHTIPPEMDVPFYINANSIRSYDEFHREIENMTGANETTIHMPITNQELSEYYLIDDIPAYKKICDEIEKISTEQDNSKSKHFALNRIKFMFNNLFIFKLVFKKVYQILFYNFNFKIKSAKLREKYYVNDWENSIMHQRSAINNEKYNLIKQVLSNGEQ